MATIDLIKNNSVKAYRLGDDEYSIWGTGKDAGQGWNTDQTQDALTTFVSGSNTWIFGTKANVYDPGGLDLGLAASTDPLFVITSSTGWGTATNQYLAFHYNAAGSYGSIDVGTGTIRMQDEVVMTSHVYFGDSDCIYMGDGNDSYWNFDGTDLVWVFASLGAADADGGSWKLTAQSAGTTNDHDGGSIIMEPGALNGAGSDGKFIIRQPGTSGADDIQIWTDGTTASINVHGGVAMALQTGDSTRLNINSSVTAIYPATDATWDCGYTGLHWKAVLVGEDTTTGSISTSGLMFGRANEARLRYNKDATGYPASSLILGLEASGTAAKDSLAFSSATISGFANVTNDTAGEAIYQATQTGGTSTSGNGLAGGSLFFEIGAGSDAFGGGGGDGGAGGDFVVIPGAGGALDGGGSAGADGTFIVRQPGGTPGTDDLYMRHTGSDSLIDTASGSLRFNSVGGGAVYSGGTFMPIGAKDIGSSTYYWRMGYFGTADIQTTSTDGLLLTNPEAATAGVTVQMGPRLRLRGSAWKSNATAASHTSDWIMEGLPATGAAAITSNLQFKHSNNGGAYSASLLTIASSGIVSVATSVNTPILYNYASTLAVQNQNFTSADSAIEMATGTASNTTGEFNAVEIKPTINQASGDGSWNALKLNVTTTAEGSGGGLFIQAKNDTVQKFYVSSGGELYAASNINVPRIRSSSGTFTFQDTSFSIADSAIEAVGGTHTQDGTQFVGMHIKPTYNQSNAAAASDLVVSRTETSVGSGDQFLMDLGTTTDGTYANHTSMFRVTNTGVVYSRSISMADGYNLDAGTTTDDYFLIRAFDTGNAMTKVGIVAGGADPYVAFGGSNEFVFYESGLFVANGVTRILDTQSLDAGYTTDDYFIIRAFDTGNAMVQVGAVRGGADPYMSLGGNDELRVYNTGWVSCDCTLSIRDGRNIDAGTTTDDYFLIRAFDTGNAMVEVGRVAGAADPYFGLGVNGNVLKATNGGNLGFFGATPTSQLLKANYNNWAAFTDVVDALVAIGLFDQA